MLTGISIFWVPNRWQYTLNLFFKEPALAAYPDTDTRAEVKFLVSGYGTTRPLYWISKRYGVFRE
jgi:hypothetical protein